jgi:hypothetical protein
MTELRLPRARPGREGGRRQPLAASDRRALGQRHHDPRCRQGARRGAVELLQCGDTGVLRGARDSSQGGPRLHLGRLGRRPREVPRERSARERVPGRAAPRGTHDGAGARHPGGHRDHRRAGQRPLRQRARHGPAPDLRLARRRPHAQHVLGPRAPSPCSRRSWPWSASTACSSSWSRAARARSGSAWRSVRSAGAWCAWCCARRRCSSPWASSRASPALSPERVSSRASSSA